MSIRSLTVALMSGAALVAVQLPAVAATDFVAKQAAGEASSSGVIGTKIKNSTGEAIGDVNYLVLDESGNVTTVVIGVGGFLGVGEKNVGVPFKAVSRQADDAGNPVYILNATKEELNAAPAYEWVEKGAVQKAADTVKEKAAEAADAVKEKAAEVKDKTEDMTKANEPAPSSTGGSEGTAGTSDAPAEKK